MAEKSFSKLSSDTISALRFPLMVGIVFIHFGVLEGIKVQGVTYGANPPDWLAFVNIFFSKVIPTIGVPLFFIISGYFFSISGLTKDSYKRKLQKRARTLLVPYLLWNIIAILYGYSHSLPWLHSIFPNAHFEWSWTRFFYSFWDGNYGLLGKCSDEPRTFMNPADPPMWFVRDLMIVMILSPILHWAIKKVGWIAVALLGAIWIVFVRLPLGHINYLLAAFFFFSWGMCYAVKGIDFVASMRRFRIALWIYPVFALADALMLLFECHGRSPIHNLGIILGIFTAVSIMGILIEKSKIRTAKFLPDSSFFLFALHMIIIGDVSKIIVKLSFVDSPYYMALLYFLVPTITILICLALYWLLRRFTPRLCALLTGGR